MALSRAPILLLIAAAGLARADNALHPGKPVLDRPTLTSLGIQLPVTGDDNYNAVVTVQFRKAGAASWTPALPLFRVHPDTTLPYVIAPQFSGSILDLRPATTYDIQLHVTDPDGRLDRTFSLSGTTRAVPRDPAHPRARAVSDSKSLTQTLGSAKPGDIITLANGTYKGEFAVYASGTAEDPIVIRGASQDGVVINGNNCEGCNIWEIYGSWIHLERLTVENGQRAIRFQKAGSQGNVVRRVHIRNTTMAIGSRDKQLDFYIADNIVEGRLKWPAIYSDDDGKHSGDDGIQVTGAGHVVAHNRISGFGDAMKTAEDGARAVDFYGNDILFSYDNGIELDGAEGNARCMRNRFSNTYMTISGQPIFGGPAYIYRNVAVNSIEEQFKLHSQANPTREPNGALIYNNTFVSTKYALALSTPTAVHHFALENNIFIGPAQPTEDMTVDWFAFIDDGLFDYNGYWPDKYFAYNYRKKRLKVDNFKALQKAGMEVHGVLLNPRTLANGMVGPKSYKKLIAPPDFALSANSLAIDRGVVLPNITDGYTGAAPDLGALEAGCPAPTYGPRPEGVDETNEIFGCPAVK